MRTGMPDNKDIGFEATSNRFYVQWRVYVDGKSTPRKICVSCNALPKDAAERVAIRLQAEIEKTTVKNKTDMFWEGA